MNFIAYSKGGIKRTTQSPLELEDFPLVLENCFDNGGRSSGDMLTLQKPSE
jgi:hypothetical protein